MGAREVIVEKLPRCALHGDRDAEYDAKTTAGPWGYLCQECFQSVGLGLGVGLGQRLVVRS